MSGGTVTGGRRGGDDDVVAMGTFNLSDMGKGKRLGRHMSPIRAVAINRVEKMIWKLRVLPLAHCTSLSIAI